MNIPGIKKEIEQIRDACEELLLKLDENQINIVLAERDVGNTRFAFSIFEMNGTTKDESMTHSTDNHEGILRLLNEINQSIMIRDIVENQSPINIYTDIPFTDLLKEEKGELIFDFIAGLSNITKVTRLSLDRYERKGKLSRYIEEIVRDNETNINLSGAEPRGQSQSREATPNQ